ncbi:MAG: CGNR zinc finger domain-containing protein [Solirubrobacteraceae bacterium]
MASPPGPDSAAPTTRAPAPGRLELVEAFVNTRDLETQTDALSDLGALRAWLAARRLIPRGVALAPEDLVRAKLAREALRELLDHRAPGSRRQAASRRLNAIAASAPLRVSLDREGRPALRPTAGGLDGALAQLFAIIERAEAQGTWARLKVCADNSCRWAFYDHSKNRSRTWCNMADCGNRAKARRYRSRQRGRRSGA